MYNMLHHNGDESSVNPHPHSQETDELMEMETFLGHAHSVENQLRNEDSQEPVGNSNDSGECGIEEDSPTNDGQENDSGVQFTEMPSTSGSIKPTEESVFDGDYYEKGGLVKSLHGIVYQLKLIMLFALRGNKLGYDFKMATEMVAADSFDDVVFKYVANDGKTFIRYLQAKHKITTAKILVKDLVKGSSKKENSDFSIHKYFTAYKNIRTNYGKTFMADFTICTNTTFDFETQIKLNKDNSENQKTLKINERKQRMQGLFLEPREISSDDKLLYCQGRGKIYQFNLNKFEKIKAAFSKFSRDVQFKEFLKKFRIIVDCPDVDDLTEILENEFQHKYSLLNVELLTGYFQSDMLQWFKMREGKFFTKLDSDKFFKDLKEKFNTLSIQCVTETNISALNKFQIEYKQTLTLENILSNFVESATKRGILVINTHSPLLTSIKVSQCIKNIDFFQCRDKYIFIRICETTEDYLQHIVSLQTNQTVLIIEVNPKMVTRLIRMAASINKYRKQIIITEQHQLLINELKKHQAIPDEHWDNCSFMDLNKASKQVILNKEISFQEKTLPLDHLISKDICKKYLDSKCLSMLIQQNKPVIGNNKAFSSPEFIEDCFIARTFKTDMFDKGLKEEHFINQNFWKIIILAGDPGMGKSTVLTNIARKMRTATNYWCVRINLRHHVEILEKIKLSETGEDAKIDYITQMCFKNDSSVSICTESSTLPSEKLFKIILKATGFYQLPLVVLIDGFDEICPEHKIITTDLLKVLIRCHVKQLWITTRVHEEEDLERELSSSAYRMNILSRDEQIQFLNKFWKYSLKYYKSDLTPSRLYDMIVNQLDNLLNIGEFPYNDEFRDIIRKMESVVDLSTNSESKLVYLRSQVDELDFKPYARFVIDKWTESIHDNDKKFSHIPINLKLLGEIVFEDKFNVPSNIRINDLYEKLVNKKFEVHRSKIPFRDITMEKTQKGSKCGINGNHQVLAIGEVFPDDGISEYMERQTKKMSKESIETLISIGLIQVSGTNMHFNHKSFAEYFVAKFIVQNPQKQFAMKLLSHVLCEKKHRLVRQFLNSQLTEDIISAFIVTNDMKRKFVTTYGLRSKENIVSPLFTASQENHELIIKFLMEKFNQPKYLKPLLLSYENISPLFAALENENVRASVDYIFNILLSNDDDSTDINSTAKGIISGMRQHEELLIEQLKNSFILFFRVIANTPELIKFYMDKLQIILKKFPEMLSENSLIFRETLTVLARNGHTDGVADLLYMFKNDKKSLHKLFLYNKEYLLYSVIEGNSSKSAQPFATIVSLLHEYDKILLKQLFTKSYNRTIPSVMHYAIDIKFDKNGIKYMMEAIADTDENLYREILKLGSSRNNYILILAIQNEVNGLVDQIIKFILKIKDSVERKKHICVHGNKQYNILHTAVEKNNQVGLEIIIKNLLIDRNILTHLLHQTNSASKSPLEMSDGKNRSGCKKVFEKYEVFWNSNEEPLAKKSRIDAGSYH